MVSPNRSNYQNILAPRSRPARCGTALIALAGVALPLACLAEPGTLSVELNKLESSDKGCRAYLVINNTTGTVYQTMKLDLVMFQPDGIIGKRFALDLAPLKAQKKAVKLFDLEATSCDKVGSFLINDIVECKAESGPLTDCLAQLTLSTLSSVTISK